MLGIGIDWAEEFHDIALGTVEKGVIEQFRIPHGPDGVAALVERALRLEPDPAEVRVVIETRLGLLVEALVDAGFTVLPVNPDLVARRRGPARKKDDAKDAPIACLLALDRHTALPPLVPMASWPLSCAPSPATTNGPPQTSAACSTGWARSCSPPTQPSWPSPATTWAPRPC